MWFPARLIHVRPLSRAVQAVRVALAVDRPTAFAVALVRGGEAAFTARRTGQRVHLRPRHDLQVAREHVSKDALRPPPEVAARLAARGPVRVADIGANIGLFTLAALHAYGPGTTVVAIEPDPDNVGLLRRNVAANGYADRVSVHEVAAGTADGVLRFLGGRYERSRAAADHEDGPGLITVPVTDVSALAAGCDLAKLDIEGGEWPILHDPRVGELAAIALVLEWHATAGPTAAADAARLLRAAGYEVGPSTDPSLAVGLIWAWRP